jgi:hypothetical protein
VEYFKTLLVGTSDRYLFDGFPPACEGVQHFEQFMSIGRASWVLHLVVSREQLWKRFKIKSEMDAA